MIKVRARKCQYLSYNCYGYLYATIRLLFIPTSIHTDNDDDHQIRRKFCLQMFLEHWRMKSGDLKCNRLSVRIIWQLLNLHITATLFNIFLKMTPSFTEFHIGVLHWKVYLHQNGFLTPHKKLGRFLEKDKYFFIN